MQPMLTFIVITIGLALALHLLLFGITKLFGKGGEGTLGDIRSAIGASLPTPLGVAIWVIASTLIAQKLVEHFAWSPIDLESSEGESVITIDILISMIRTGLLVIITTWFVARGVRAFSSILNNWHHSKDTIELDTTAIQALASVGVVITWVVGFIVTLQSLGFNMNAVITIGGIGGAGIAFASKDVVANFFGGIVVMLNRPFKIGDHIVSGKIDGKVMRIGLYATYLETENGDTLYVPNSIFNNSEILTVNVT
ncbi:MAG TPA: mechanosensitive ion channel family protein [Phycisphaerales bacterium]|nr:mechanosensitive ion channel family protein [Phycisphaerales bacterium]HIB01206.1 mechanosensitive ion channel family protein [Phycisphaerales bacterium]HIN83727.1 mechanosensitive ion channel family protein [Phycisphaerales bacterium]HIO53302.1 mechanosensitive ion channel family protein [Phycisphaerales bacterium]